MLIQVTDVPNQQNGRIAPLEFRFHVAMQGILGVGGDIGEWPVEDLEAARQFIETYKRIRPVVQTGVQYWLIPPAPIGPCAVQYVSPDGTQSVVLMYQVRGQVGAGTRRARLQGLLPEKRYRREVDGLESTGAALMSAGVPLNLASIVDGKVSLDWRSRLDVWRAV
jgi:alpha-galactosidase